MEVERVAVIGAGPCGLGVAKYLLAEKKFKTIIMFEQRDRPGGVWNYTSDHGINDASVLSHSKPSQEPQQSVDGIFISPVYDSLETNIPKSMMQFIETSFPARAALFPTHVVVKDYLHQYAEELKPLIRLQSLILDVVLSKKHPNPEWTVTWCDLKTGDTLVEQFDAVVVANGHHNDPYIPEIAGLAEWNRAYPGSIIHSSSYRRPEPFSNKKVIVVGHSASGIDIANQIARVSKHPLLISERTATSLSPEQAAVADTLPEISLLSAEDGRVLFVNGHEEREVDHIIFCTGYHFSIPFLSSLQPPLVTDGVRPHHLYQHIFYSKEPTLALIGFPQRIVPFPFSQAQGAWLARVLSGRVALPSEIEMERWIGEWAVDHGDGHSFNILAFPLDANYINTLYELSSRAERKEGLENGGHGRRPPFWGEKEKWTRARFPLIKNAAQALGDRRTEVTTVEQLGFDFDREIAPNAEVGNPRL
ncbi:Dimethylaniline monooxygenase, putative [Penicillium digitatum PHI26]|uniref:Dimethylaniline monooxygenase, putative n=1 Tax=Penicillium digitatum (strain PHI26 / CECT 20796) TaxID=1170229 RepID=K9H1P2_PEND2|nr:Dimethylaniline monooxygenase, putative [Penicillium digitatum PHI26]